MESPSAPHDDEEDFVERQSYLDGEGVTPELVATVMGALARLAEAAPWRDRRIDGLLFEIAAPAKKQLIVHAPRPAPRFPCWFLYRSVRAFAEFLAPLAFDERDTRGEPRRLLVDSIPLSSARRAAALRARTPSLAGVRREGAEPPRVGRRLPASGTFRRRARRAGCRRRRPCGSPRRDDAAGVAQRACDRLHARRRSAGQRDAGADPRTAVARLHATTRSRACWIAERHDLRAYGRRAVRSRRLAGHAAWNRTRMMAS